MTEHEPMQPLTVSQMETLEEAVCKYEADMTVELHNGKTFILVDGWVEGEITINTEEGSYDVEFRGLDMQEQVAS